MFKKNNFCDFPEEQILCFSDEPNDKGGKSEIAELAPLQVYPFTLHPLTYCILVDFHCDILDESIWSF